MMQARGIRSALILVMMLLPAFSALGQRQISPEELAQRRALNAERRKFRVVLVPSAELSRSLVSAALAVKFGARLETDLKEAIILELPRGEAVRIAHDPRVLSVEEVEVKREQPKAAAESGDGTPWRERTHRVARNPASAGVEERTVLVRRRGKHHFDRTGHRSDDGYLRLRFDVPFDERQCAC